MNSSENFQRNQDLTYQSMFSHDPEAGEIFYRFLQTEQGKRVNKALVMYKFELLETLANSPDDFALICRKGEIKLLKRLFNI